MGHPMGLELTRESLLEEIANHYTTGGTHIECKYISSMSYYII